MIEFHGTTQEGREIVHRRNRAKHLQDLKDSLDRTGHEKEAHALWTCGRYFSVGRCPDGGHRLAPNPCNSMFCADCAARRSRSLQSRVLSKCQKKGRSYFFLTLTVPNIERLTRGQVDHLIDCFARLRKTRTWKNVKPSRSGTTDGASNGEAQGISGGVYSVECVYNKVKNNWHPHIHALIELPTGKISEAWLDSLKAEWFSITGNAKYLHLMRVYGRSKSGKKLHRRVNRKSLKELVKYVTKCADFADQPDRVSEFLEAFRDVKRIQSFGSFLKVVVEAEREPGDDRGLLACSCGGEHRHSEFKWFRSPVHISQTVLMSDGSRQLKFDFARELESSQPEEPPPWEMTAQQVATSEQKGIEFSGPLPDQQARAIAPWLFSAA